MKNTATGLTATETGRIQGLIERNRDLIHQCGFELATNFECPAQRIIGVYCAKMGISRLDWEKITAVKNGWAYTAPPADILARWATY